MTMTSKYQRFVDLKKYGFVIEPRYYFSGWSKSSKILGRRSAVLALVRAKKLLPKGYNFKIWDCQRPYKVQELMTISFRKRLKLLYPNATVQEKKKLLLKFSGGLVKKIDGLGTHRNGGAFDLTIIDQNREELFMGTDFDDLTKKAQTNFYENKKGITILEKEAKKNRRLLVKTMKLAGFVNYSEEWWHWSFNK